MKKRVRGLEQMKLLLVDANERGSSLNEKGRLLEKIDCLVADIG